MRERSGYETVVGPLFFSVGSKSLAEYVRTRRGRANEISCKLRSYFARAPDRLLKTTAEHSLTTGRSFGVTRTTPRVFLGGCRTRVRDITSFSDTAAHAARV